MKTRISWQEKGMDPDSEDEVNAFLHRHGKDDYPSSPGVLTDLKALECSKEKSLEAEEIMELLNLGLDDDSITPVVTKRPKRS
jgi:hypothetical protein